MKKRNKIQPPPQITAVYQPSKNGTDKLLHAMLRYLVLLTAVLGMAVMGSSMLGLDIGFGTIILTSAYTFTTFYLLFKSLWGLIGGILIGAGGMLIALSTYSLTLKEFFIGGYRGIFNAVLDIIRARGYETVPQLNTHIVTEFGILVLITAPAALIVGLTSRKRTRVIPYAVVLLVPTVVFIVTGGEAQLRYFAPAVAAACAMAVMGLAEKGVKGVAPSSYAGFAALVLAGLLMLTPIVNTSAAMKRISFPELIDIGEIIGSGGAEGLTQKSVRPKKYRYNGNRIMTVYSNSDTPMYFRTWAGGHYGDNKWYAVDYDYGYNYGAFVSQNDYYDLTKDFYKKAASLGYDGASLGLRFDDIKINMSVSTRTLPLPSMSKRIGEIYDDGKTTYAYYKYDGISSLESSWMGEITTSAAVIYKDSPHLSDVIYGYLEYLIGYCAHGIYPKSSIGKQFASRLYKYGNNELIEISQKYTSFAKSAYGEGVKDEAIERAVEELFENASLREYFDKLYPEDSLSPLVTDGLICYDGYFYKLNNYGMAHAYEIAGIVADYLADGRKYTTNPKSTGKSVTEELLYGSKQGYCVQFATVGTLIMRRMGFYARYAEGYLAQDFKNSGSDYSFENKISDKDGHAWCEVWVDGFGWMTLEMTPGQGNNGGGGGDTTPPPDTTPPETSDTPITTPPETDTSFSDTTEAPPDTTPPITSGRETTVSGYEGKGGRKSFDPITPIVISAVILIPTVMLVSYLVSNTVKKKKRLDALINKAISGSHTSEEIRVLSASLSRMLSLALGAYKALPRVGELPEDYGLRLEGTLKLDGLEAPISLCVNALVKQAYGFGMDETDIKISAFTLRALRTNALRRIGIFRFVIYRIKGVL